jgi:hypothetical protein
MADSKSEWPTEKTLTAVFTETNDNGIYLRLLEKDRSYFVQIDDDVTLDFEFHTIKVIVLKK